MHLLSLLGGCLCLVSAGSVLARLPDRQDAGEPYQYHSRADYEAAKAAEAVVRQRYFRVLCLGLVGLALGFTAVLTAYYRF